MTTSSAADIDGTVTVAGADAVADAGATIADPLAPGDDCPVGATEGAPDAPRTGWPEEEQPARTTASAVTKDRRTM
ncbi:MAG: hypothetical protein ACRDV3_11615 [Acidothermaceae bacterium]